jgi:hypothetical protein
MNLKIYSFLYLKMSNKFLDEITKLQNQYYSNNNKNVFLKSKQKLEVASYVSNTMDLHDLINKSIYILPNTHYVYIDYTVLKMYANPNNYDTIIHHIMSLFNECIVTHGGFSCHINIDSFTISACERHKSVIEKFVTKCMNSDTQFAERLDKMIIYNTPLIFDNIITMLNPLIDPNVKTKLLYYNKKESPLLIQKLIG